MLPRPARGQDARRVAHHVHNQSGVVGDGRQAGETGHKPRFEQCVLLEGDARLDRVGQAEAAGGDKLRLSGVRAQILFENAADFNEFAFVVRSDDEFHGGPLFLTYGCA